MKIPFAKSLDRPVEIFGVKGKWLMVFGCCAGAGLFVALIIGMGAGAGPGIGCAIFLAVLSFIICLTAQGKVSHRELKKLQAQKKRYPYLIKTETICRILTVDPKFKEKETGNNDTKE